MCKNSIPHIPTTGDISAMRCRPVLITVLGSLYNCNKTSFYCSFIAVVLQLCGPLYMVTNMSVQLFYCTAASAVKERAIQHFFLCCSCADALCTHCTCASDKLVKITYLFIYLLTLLQRPKNLSNCFKVT